MFYTLFRSCRCKITYFLLILQQKNVPGHQIAEMALCKLYVLTGEKKYLDEARLLLDYRGRTWIM